MAGELQSHAYKRRWWHLKWEDGEGGSGRRSHKTLETTTTTWRNPGMGYEGSWHFLSREVTSASLRMGPLPLWEIYFLGFSFKF